ncbi:hypothetical protein [Spirosoma oryzicola]|uniref:hypothetical protein n=1 Tax=Spirosoma oryzicola TaxID=2898794 RepID=UPI001E395843|nr:hypothetical protein [Spirosoma oryzicola]UHG92530.1 hypothetical protein LQ777_06385 [Spirosoma oryzicola]
MARRKKVGIRKQSSYKANKADTNLPAKPITSYNKKSVSPASNKSIWNSIKSTSIKAWTLYGALVTLTGFTINNILPDAELSLIQPTDRPQILFELKNNSWVKMDTVAYTLYVLSIHTLEGDDVDSVILSTKYIRDVGLRRSEVQPIEIDLNNYFFHYTNPPHFFEAKLAVVIHSGYFGSRQDDTFYFESINDYHGGYHWTKMPEQNFVEAMKKSKKKASYMDIPFMRHMIEEGDTNMGEGKMPPPEILEQMRRVNKYKN